MSSRFAVRGAASPTNPAATTFVTEKEPHVSTTTTAQQLPLPRVAKAPLAATGSCVGGSSSGGGGGVSGGGSSSIGSSSSYGGGGIFGIAGGGGGSSGVSDDDFDYDDDNDDEFAHSGDITDLAEFNADEDKGVYDMPVGDSAEDVAHGTGGGSAAQTRTPSATAGSRDARRVPSTAALRSAKRKSEQGAAALASAGRSGNGSGAGDCGSGEAAASPAHASAYAAAAAGPGGDGGDGGDGSADRGAPRLCPFIEHLDVIVAGGPSNVICWNSAGTHFVINDAKALAPILQKHFKSGSYASFTRQLNFYGFVKANKKRTKEMGYALERQVFSHPYFVRGRDDLICAIRRKTHHDFSAQRSPEDVLSDEITSMRQRHHDLKRRHRALRAALDAATAELSRRESHAPTMAASSAPAAFAATASDALPNNCSAAPSAEQVAATATACVPPGGDKKKYFCGDDETTLARVVVVNSAAVPAGVDGRSQAHRNDGEAAVAVLAAASAFNPGVSRASSASASAAASAPMSAAVATSPTPCPPSSSLTKMALTTADVVAAAPVPAPTADLVRMARALLLRPYVSDVDDVGMRAVALALAASQQTEDPASRTAAVRAALAVAARAGGSGSEALKQEDVDVAADAFIATTVAGTRPRSIISTIYRAADAEAAVAEAADSPCGTVPTPCLSAVPKGTVSTTADAVAVAASSAAPGAGQGTSAASASSDTSAAAAAIVAAADASNGTGNAATAATVSACAGRAMAAAVTATAALERARHVDGDLASKLAAATFAKAAAQVAATAAIRAAHAAGLAHLAAQVAVVEQAAGSLPGGREAALRTLLSPAPEVPERRSQRARKPSRIALGEAAHRIATAVSSDNRGMSGGVAVNAASASAAATTAATYLEDTRFGVAHGAATPANLRRDTRRAIAAVDDDSSGAGSRSHAGIRLDKYMPPPASKRARFESPMYDEAVDILSALRQGHSGRTCSGGVLRGGISGSGGMSGGGGSGGSSGGRDKLLPEEYICAADDDDADSGPYAGYDDEAFMGSSDDASDDVREMPSAGAMTLTAVI